MQTRSWFNWVLLSHTSVKDSGARVYNIHRPLDLRVNARLTCAAPERLLSLKHREEHVFMRCKEELLDLQEI